VGRGGGFHRPSFSATIEWGKNNRRHEMGPKTYWVVKSLHQSGTYLTGIDEDGREFVPVYSSKKAAKEAADRSDLEFDDWIIVPVNLP
jgi:hypothetical protein